MALSIVWLKRAEAKFDGILMYLQAEWGTAVTSAFVRKVYNFLDILVEYPEVGTLENPKKGIRGFVITKHTTIFYKIQNDKIIILNFFDNRQHPKNKKY